MTQIDLKRELKHLYQAPAREGVRVDVPPRRFLMADAAGDPHAMPACAEAVEALFSASRAAKRTKGGRP